MTAPFVCSGCGDSWEKDPRLAVACSACGAKAGVGCRRPSEHSGGFVQPHKARRTLAFELAPCGCLAIWEAAQQPAQGVLL